MICILWAGVIGNFHILHILHRQILPEGAFFFQIAFSYNSFWWGRNVKEPVCAHKKWHIATPPNIPPVVPGRAEKDIFRGQYLGRSLLVYRHVPHIYAIFQAFSGIFWNSQKLSRIPWGISRNSLEFPEFPETCWNSQGF